MAKLIIGAPETAEKETEVRFWLEESKGVLWLWANAGNFNQILLSISDFGRVAAFGIADPELIAFFNGSVEPLAKLD